MAYTTPDIAQLEMKLLVMLKSNTNDLEEKQDSKMNLMKTMIFGL
jgi:hypothetical protein